MVVVHRECLFVLVLLLTLPAAQRDSGVAYCLTGALGMTRPPSTPTFL